MQKQRSLGKRSRRPRHEAPKVWHNPDVVTTPGSRGPSQSDGTSAKSGRGGDGRAPGSRVGASSAIAAGVTRRSGAASDDHGEKAQGERSRSPRIVAAATGASDPVALERERLVARLTSAEGRPAITRAADAILAAGHTLPEDDQTVQLQLLEHSKEEYVEAALERLAHILASEPCKRQTVLESRLRRLEQFADEPTTREAARRLWRQVTGRTSADAGPATLRSETE